MAGIVENLSENLKINAIRRMFGMLHIRKSEVAMLVLFAGLYAIFEGFGISLLLPVLQFAQSGPAAIVAQGGSKIWGLILSTTDALHLPLNFFTLLLLAFIPILLRQVTFYGSSWYTARAQTNAVLRIRTEAFNGLMGADPSFLAARQPGDLIAYLTGQTEASGQAVLAFARLLAVVALVILYSLILMYVSPFLTVLAIAAVLLMTYVSRWSIKRARSLGAQASDISRRMYVAISERVHLARLIKMMGQEEVESRHVQELSDEVRVANQGILMSLADIEITVDPALMLAAFGVLYIGVEYLHMTLAGLGIFLFILLRMNAKAKEFSTVRQSLSANLESLLFVHRTTQEVHEARTLHDGSRQFAGLAHSVDFDNVNFCYQSGEDGSTDVLRDVSASIRAGELTALVGRSGAGKSTLVELIPRLRDATAGRVAFDGVDAREFNLRSLRRRVGYMTQEAMLFDTSIRENLLYGLERAVTEDELWAALDQAYASGFVRKTTDGLDTAIGNRGTRLSGGERQRIVLARVLLQNPDILILDEPTSALDSESEQYIQKALEALHGQKTIIVIAHRLSTVQKADQILAMDDGKIVERGTHEELLALNRVYARLFLQQLSVGMAPSAVEEGRTAPAEAEGEPDE